MQEAKVNRQPFCLNDIHTLKAPLRPPVPQYVSQVLNESPVIADGVDVASGYG